MIYTPLDSRIEAPALPKFPILESQGVYLQKIAPFYLYSNFKIQERTTKECSLIRAFVQEVEIQFALQRIQEVGQLYQKIPLPSSRSLSLLSFTPYAIAGLLFAASFFSEGIFHKGLHCIHNHVGMFAQTVSLIAAFALLYFGQWSLGGLTMGFMALGELQSRSIFPSRFWSVFNIAGSGLTLAFGSWMLRGLVLVDFCLSSLFQEMEERGPKKCELVEISPLKAIDEKRLRVNKDHIFYPISSNPDDLRDLLFQSLRNLRKKKVQELISSLKEQLPFLDSFLQEVEKDAFPFVFGLDEQASKPPFLHLMMTTVWKKCLCADTYTKKEIFTCALQMTAQNEQLFIDWCSNRKLTEIPLRDQVYLFLIESGVFTR